MFAGFPKRRPLFRNEETQMAIPFSDYTPSGSAGPRMDHKTLPWPMLLKCLQVIPADEKAWQEFRHRLLRHAWKITGYKNYVESAEDLVHKFIFKVIENMQMFDRIDGNQSPDSYFKRALTNKYSDIARRNLHGLKATRQIAAEQQRRSSPELCSNMEVITTLHMVLARLSFEQLELLKWRFWEEQPIQAIADQLGEKYSAIAVRIFRILKELKQALNASGFFDRKA
jgi:RNA polymerase sigma factor (sigma-70 family)